MYYHVVLFVGKCNISYSGSPSSENKKRGRIKRKHHLFFTCVYKLYECVLTYCSLDFGAGWHEGMGLLHYAAWEVTNASLLLSVIGVLYLKTDQLDLNLTWRGTQHDFNKDTTSVLV